jgi:UDP-3-O-[3-hydroxymyristoyl] glucosamine N-acyltransferase
VVQALDVVVVEDITHQLGGKLVGDGQARVDRLGPLEGATPSTLTFFSNPRLQSQLLASKAGCVILAPAVQDLVLACTARIVTPDPYLYFARLTQWWAARLRPKVLPGVHVTAVVDPTACIAPTASVAAFAVIEAGAVLEDGACVGAHCFVGERAVVGAGTRLAPHVTLGAGCTVGARGLVHSGAVIGADGFGFAQADPGWEKIEQFGNVCIGHDVEIGANTCIDRGALGDTIIEDGVKLDNQIQIGHNVRIGAHSALAGCVGVAGSAVIGKHCTVGGAGMILGHLTLADHVHISAASVVMRSLHKPGQYSGVFPIDENAAWEKNAATLRQLHSLRERLRAAEKRLLELTVSSLPPPP